VKHGTFSWIRLAGLVPLTLLLSALLLIGCNSSRDDAQNDSHGVLGVADQAAAASQTPMSAKAGADATREAFLANEQKRRQAAETKAAQTPAATRTIPPPETAVPQRTPGLGLRTCGMGDRSFRMTSCWAGKLGNEYVYVNAGVLRDDSLQGGIQVFTTTLDGLSVSQFITYPSPEKQGPLEIAYVTMPRLTLIAPPNDVSGPAAPTFVYNLQTRQWEANSSCKVYPLAFHADTFRGAKTHFDKIKVALNTGNSPSSGFGWLAHTAASANGADASKTANPGNGAASTLPKPGEDVDYTNTEDANDHKASVGDWLQAGDGTGTSPDTANPFDFLRVSGFLVPVPLWDKATGQGKNLKYHVSGFAWARVIGSDAYPPTSLTLQYWGPANCSAK
jgi:hypothetical protein